MAKTTPSRAKSKTPAPKKALTPIEKRIISLEVRLSAGAKVRGLQDARITKLELYGTANVDSWIEQHDNRIKAIEGRLDKLASPTVAVEEIKLQPLCHGDYTLASHEVAEKLTAMGFRAKSDKTYPAHEFVGWDSHSRVIEGRSGLIGKPLAQSDFLARAAVTAKELGLEPVEEKWVPKDLSYVMITDNHSVSRLRGTIQVVDGYVNASGHIDTLRGQECGAGPNSYRKPTPEEIAAHEAKVKAEAQAAEDAKLVFGARVEHISRGKGIWMGMDGILHELAFLNHGEGRLHQWSIVTCPRLTFTLLP